MSVHVTLDGGGWALVGGAVGAGAHWIATIPLRAPRKVRAEDVHQEASGAPPGAPGAVADDPEQH